MRQFWAQMECNRQRSHVSRSRLYRENLFYMDDYFESSPTVEQTTRKARDLVKMSAKKGFTRTKLVSNLRGELSTLNRMENPIAGNVKASAVEDESSHVLGLEWNYQFYTLAVSRGTGPDRNLTLTQNFVLSFVSAVYYPLGIVAPYTVKARLLLKENRRLSGEQWDDNIPGHLADTFLDWSEELTTLAEITIPRRYFDGQLEKVELHIFGDSL